MINKQSYYLAGITAFLIWGFVSIPFRALGEYQAGQILYFRIVFAACFLGLFFLFFRRKTAYETVSLLRSFSFKQRAKFFGLTCIGGLLLATNWLVFLYVVQHVSIKAATFSYFICPVITAVLGYFLIQEKLARKQWMAVGICIISCVLVGKDSLREMGYSLIVGSTYALYVVSQRKNIVIDRLFILLIQLLIIALLLAPFYTVLVGQAPVAGDFYRRIIVIAIVFTLIPLFLNLYALKGLSSGVIGFLMYMNPLVSFLLALFYFHEPMPQLQIIAYLLIVGAIILFNYDAWIKVRKNIK